MEAKDFIPAGLMGRPRYVERLLPYVGKPIIKVLTGMRRVGKSYILFLIMKHLIEQDSDVHIVYLNLEDLRFDHLRDYQTLNHYICREMEGHRRCAVFIDEIQGIAEFEKVLRSLLLRPDTDIYVTGSNSKMLSGELATLLTGRYIEVAVQSLSYPEFIEFHSLEEGEDALQMYMRFGGMPYLTNLTLTDRVAYEYLQTVHSSIVYRDVVERFGVRNTNFLERLVQFVCDNIGNLFTAKSISGYLKSQGTNMAPASVLTYMDYLAQAFIVSKVSRYDIIGKRRFEIGEKYYYGDVGLRNAVVGYGPQSRGQIVENLVYNHLTFMEYQVEVGVTGTHEIDFVAQRGGETCYVQAALTLGDDKTMEREFGNLAQIPDNYPKYVVSLDATTPNTWQGIRHLSLRDFLRRDAL